MNFSELRCKNCSAVSTAAVDEIGYRRLLLPIRSSSMGRRQNRSPPRRNLKNPSANASSGVKRPAMFCPATAHAPVSVAMSMIASGFCLQKTERVGEKKIPSASVFSISTVLPFRIRSISSKETICRRACFQRPGQSRAVRGMFIFAAPRRIANTFDAPVLSPSSSA